MKAILLITGLLVCLSATVNAQEAARKLPEYVEIYSTGYDGSQVAIHIRPDGRYADIKGSPYLDEEWKPGRIYLLSDTVGAAFLMRYNVYANEMQFISHADTLAISNPLKVKRIFLDGRCFEYLPFLLNANENMAWFSILESGKSRLLLRYGSRLERGTDPVTPYHCQNASDHFAAGKYYYYQTADMAMPAEIPTSRNAFANIKAFGKPEIREYIKTHKISLRNEKDLVDLFSWINLSPDKK